MTNNVILLLGNYRPSLSIARSLGSLGYRVVMSSGGGEGCCEYSRFVSEEWDHPAVEAGESQFLEALSAFLRERPDIKLVFPIAEPYVRCLARTAGRLPPDVTVVSPAPSTVLRCSDKLSTLQLGVEAGVPVLPYAVAEVGGDFNAIASRVGFPMVVRPLPPRDRFGHKKAVIIEDLRDFERFVAEWSGEKERFLFQKRAFGSRHNVYFAARDGQLLRTLETKILRTDHPDGTGLAVDGITSHPTRELTDDCRRLVSALRYTGIGLAQFQLDPVSGERCLLEINPRIAGSQDIAERLGLDGGRLAVELALGHAVAPAPSVEIDKPGFRYCWTYGDLRGLRSALAKREVGFGSATRWLLQMVAAAVQADYHMTWKLTDPKPTAMLFANQFLPRAVEGFRRSKGTAAHEHVLGAAK